MIIKKIQIEDFEDVDRLETSFDPQFAVLPSEKSKTIMKALCVALKSRSLTGEKPDQTNSDAKIEVVIDIAGTAFYINAAVSAGTTGFDHTVKTEDGKICADFYEMIYQCAEEESLCFFTFDKKNRYSDRMRRYKDVEKYYAGGSFAELTDGIGNTRLFRSRLNEYVKSFMREENVFDNDRRMLISDIWKFVLNDSFDNTALSNKDDVLFEYVCFMEINRFWQELEAIRDLNHVSWPLFISDMPEMTSGADQTPSWLKMTKNLGRQVILLSRK